MRFEDVAKATGISSADAISALKALAREGLVDLSRGRARSPLAKNLVAIPAGVSKEHRIRDIVRRGEWLTRGKEPVHFSALAVRMRKARYERFQWNLRDNVFMSGVYADPAKAQDSDVYLIEGRAYRIFD